MAIGKLVFILTYIGIGVWAIFFIPFSSMIQQNNIAVRDIENSNASPLTPPKWVYHLIGIIGCAALTLIPWTYITLAILLSLIAAQLSAADYRKQVGYGIFISLIAGSFLPWWLYDGVNRLRLDLIQSLIPIVIGGLLFYVDNRWISNTRNKQFSPQNYWQAPLYIGFLICVVFFTFTAGLSVNTASVNQWHHWGAYIGPAQLLSQGVIPFNEIPLQYGLGPSLLITYVCRTNCWNSLYYISGGFTIAMVCLLGYIALQLNTKKTFLGELFVLLIILLASLIWTALPMNLESILATPSTTGLRFLPSVLMAALIIRTLHVNHASAVYSNSQANLLPLQWRYLPHNFLWLLSLCYSPEAGVQTSVLWVSYWVLINSQISHKLINNILATSLQLTLILCIGIALFSLGFLLVWGELPKPIGYISYLIYPPGPLPVNPNGSIWFVVLILIIFFVWAKNQPLQFLNKPQNASVWIVFLLCYVNFTYFIARSADNNILNLLPYLTILLIALKNQLPNGLARIIASLLLVCIFVWLPLMGWGNYQKAFAAGNFFSLSSEALVKTFNYANPKSDIYFKNQMDLANKHDIVSAITFIDQNYHESIEVIDRFNLIDASANLPPWNGLHGPANFMYMPSSMRRSYLENVKTRLNRSGWILINTQLKESDDFIKDYSSVYQEDKRLQFGNYQAIRFLPTSLMAQ